MNTRFVDCIIRTASIVAIPVAVLAISVPASAQRTVQRQLFEWRGNVDQEIRVQMQGGRTAVMAMGPREMTRYNNVRALSALPSASGYVTVQMRRGRGRADVVEQPTARNGYTTVIRIRDTQGGAGAYDVAAFWQSDRTSSYGDRSQYGNYGRYNTYPRTVIVQQPVYDNRGVQGGKALPVPQRANTNPGQQGKALPDADQSSRQNHGWPNGY